MTPWLLLALSMAGTADVAHPMDAPAPPAPDTYYDVDGRPLGPDDLFGGPAPVFDRTIGTGITLFVNFDGIELGECNPSSSKKNCHWYNNTSEDVVFEPYSGTLQRKVSILQAMRRDAEPFGIRVTGVRPPDDEDYVMVVYGGTEEEFGNLGSAPSGDCGDLNPNEIAFAHVDGELAGWTNGGATTALHEAAHTWGLDHIDTQGAIMFPSGSNNPAAFSETCEVVVEDTELTPVDAKCPDTNMDFCGDYNRQNGVALLQYLFGEPYVDGQAPTVELVEPRDGQYFQAPATFDVLLDVTDDLHPQAYSMWAWLGDDAPPADPTLLVTPGLVVRDLPIGSWDFHLVVADEAGNETRIDFSVEVGEDPPPPPDEGCACRSGPVSGFGAARCVLVMTVLGGVARRRRRG